MRLQIRNFRCYSSFDLDLSDGSLVLLRGPSGAGKSTLLQAVAWVLFGRLRRVDPLTKPKARTEVSLEIGPLSVRRRRNPGLLEAEEKGGERKSGEEAQALVERIFGTYELWSVSCYVAQGCRNEFLSLHKAGKFALLTQAAFPSEDPVLYLGRIEEALGEERREYEREKAALLAKREEMERWVAATGASLSFLRLDPEKLEIELREEEERRTLLSRQGEERNRISGLLSFLEERLAALRRELSSLPEEDPPFEDLDAPARSLPAALSRDGLRQSLPLSDPDLPESSPEELASALQAEQARSSEESLARRFSLPYEEETIRRRTAALRSALQLQARLSEQKEVAALRRRREEIAKQEEQLEREEERRGREDSAALSVVEADLSLAEEEVERATTCPACGSAVRYRGDQLVLCSSPSSPRRLLRERERLAALRSSRSALESKVRRSQLSAARAQAALRGEGERIDKILASSPSSVLTGALLPEDKVKTLELELRTLSALLFPPPPPLPSSELRRRLAASSARQKRKQLEELERQIDPRLSALSAAEIGGRARRVEEFLGRKREREARRSVLSGEVGSLSSQLLSLSSSLPPDPSSLLAENEERRRELSSSLAAFRSAAELRERTSDLGEREKKLEERFRRLTNLSRLRSLAQEVECRTLQAVADSLNDCIAAGAAGLFSAPIGISLQLYKTGKSRNAVTKPEVNFSVTYRGGEIDSLESLSGGEADRASLLFTLALNRLLGCPFLMFDETLSSLDDDLKETTLLTLRDYAPGRTILVVSHDGVEGHYDQVVQVG